MASMKREYKKECTVEVNVGDRRVVTGTLLIHALLRVVSDIYAVVPKGNDCYDVTVPSVEEARVLVETDNIVIENQRVRARLLVSDTIVISFMHLPPYIDDMEIERYLTSKGITLEGEIKHKMIKGTDVSDGTRYVRVKFPENFTSLPYSVGFNTCDGHKYYRVIHNNQQRVCFKCNGSDHEFKNCPRTKCYKCQEFGHLARDCDNVICKACDMTKQNCDCDIFESSEEDYQKAWKDNIQFEKEFPSLPLARNSHDSVKGQSDINNECDENETEEVIDNEEPEDSKSKQSASHEQTETRSLHLSSTHGWSVTKNKRARRRQAKLSESVLKENKLKNKLRENRLNTIKKRKEEQVNEKRDISTVNSDHVCS